MKKKITLIDQRNRQGVHASRGADRWIYLILVACFVSGIGVSHSQVSNQQTLLEPVIAPPNEMQVQEIVKPQEIQKGTTAPALAPAPAMQVGDPWIVIGPASTLGGQVTIPPSNEIAGCIQAMALHPTNADILFLGAVNGGVWRTTNATAVSPSWMPLTDSLSSPSIGSLEFDPMDPTFQTLVAGSARLSSLGATGGARIGVLRTTDGGDTWSVLGSATFANENLTSVAARGTVILAASDSMWGGGSGAASTEARALELPSRWCRAPQG